MSYSVILSLPLTQLLTHTTTSATYSVTFPFDIPSYPFHGGITYPGTATSSSSLNVMDRQMALQTINSMATLTEDWDGYGGASVPPQITYVASSFLSSLPEHVPTPDVSANPNGTISMEWENDAGRAHLEIGKTRYSLYFRKAEGPPIYRDGLVNEIEQPKRKLLSAMYPVGSTQDYTINLVHMAEAA